MYNAASHTVAPSAVGRRSFVLTMLLSLMNAIKLPLRETQGPPTETKGRYSQAT